MNKEEIEALENLASAVLDLKFGESIALPWCIESFPKLDEAIKTLKEVRKIKEIKNVCSK